MKKVYSSILFVVVIAFVSLFTQCTKIDSTNLGQGLIPPVDGVNTFMTDTFTIVTENGIFNDSTRFTKDDPYMLGQLVTDPVFGRTDATIYTELKPAFQFSWRNKKDSIFGPAGTGYDSAFLNLAIANSGSDRGIYGDSNSTISFRVWAISDNTNFKKDSFYQVAVNPNIPVGTLIGTANVVPADLDNQRIAILKRDTLRTSNILRVRLNAAGDAIMSDLLSKDTTNVFKNDDNFRAHFKGFMIEPIGGGGNAMLKVSLTDTKTRFEVWYRFLNNGKVDTTFDSFAFNSFAGQAFRCASANYINRSTAGAPFLNYLTPGADSVMAIQSAPGTFATIRIPYVKSFPNKLIHRAELIIDEDPTFSHPFYTTPGNLYLDCVDTPAGKFRTVPLDFYFLTASGPADFEYFGGYRKIVSDASGTRARYFFNISKYLQAMIARNERYYDMRLYCPYDVRYHNQYIPGVPWPVINSPVFGRVVLGGGSSTRYKMKLKVIYSNI
ncbi:MAG: DUF4270 family protein [Dinghuibacter sp.]|nr:DUF4270 family protein [Dinghuibacter sp.]